MIRETVREERQETVKQKGRYKKVRKTNMVRVIRVTEDVFMTERRWHSSVDEMLAAKIPCPKKPRDMLKLGSGANTGLPKYYLIFRFRIFFQLVS